MIPLKILHLLCCIRAESLKLKGVDYDRALSFELISVRSPPSYYATPNESVLCCEGGRLLQGFDRGQKGWSSTELLRLNAVFLYPEAQNPFGCAKEPRCLCNIAVRIF